MLPKFKILSVDDKVIGVFSIDLLMMSAMLSVVKCAPDETIRADNECVITRHGEHVVRIEQFSLDKPKC